VYGGQTIDRKNGPTTLQDVHIYDMEKSQWFQPFHCLGLPRQWHTTTYLPERQLLICFGGEGKVTNALNVMVLDTEIMLWYPPTVTGDAPSNRSGHTATRLDSNLVVVFGGVKGRKWLNTVHVLDCTVWKWITVKVAGTAPPPRSYHTAVVVGTNRMIVFGGNNADQCFDSVHVLEKSCSTDDTSSGSSIDSWQWSHPTTTGVKPVARTGHSATVLEDGRTVLVYGGWDPNADDDDDDGFEETIFDDYYLLDTETWKWRKEGLASTKRVGHAAVWHEESNQVVAFGGRTPGNAFTNTFEFFANC
jgi:N-acetylneuraminic acid mutarotase